MSLAREPLLQRWRAEERSQPEGWDFSALEGRMREDPLPWDLDAIWRSALQGASSVLDMGTGGGEYLLTFRDALPGDTVATEGWDPNVAVARKALASHGVDVIAFGAPDDAPDSAPMPFSDGRFDLVLNRHEAYGPAEIARVLAPSGVFLTQQVGTGELSELHALTGAPPEQPDVSYDRFAAAAEAAGLIVTDGAAYEGSYVFVDVAALVAYLQCVPWEVPDDFSVDRYADALLALHERSSGGPIRLRMRRFWLRAQRPAD